MKPMFKKHAISVAVTLAFAGPVMAADANEEVAVKATQNAKVAEKKVESKDVEKITVTGSRLRRDSFSVATPLVTMDRDAIADTGLGSLAEILVDNMPAISESNSNTNSQSSVQNTGLSTVNLRNLGTDRTLTLIDGRRTVSNSYSGNYVSVSTIPSGMVKKIEVISGGASATYGSDAIAGVVNIITQQDKEGFGFKVRGGATPEGGGKEFTLDTDYGTTFADDRGYVFASATWDRQFGIKWSDRDRAAIESSYDYNTTKLCNEMNTIDGDQCMRDITQADWRERSDGTAGGVFEEGKSYPDGGFYYTADGLQTGWKEERDGVNPYQWDSIKVPNDRLAAAVKVDFELSDDVSLYWQAQYSKTGSVNVKSPEDEYESAYALVLDENGDLLPRVRPGFISIDNPFAPPEIAQNAGSSISWDRRFYEVGNVTTDNSRETIRTWAGLQGVAFDGAWDWDISASYGRFTQKQLRLNELNTHKVAAALDSEYAEDGVTIQCADAEWRAQGCVPLNIFGEGSITPEMADWIRATPEITTEIEQINALGYIAGDLFELPAGNVSAVFGAEYRKDTQDLKTNKEQRLGGVTFNVVPSFYGELDIFEVFGELALPLLKNAPMAKSLTAEVSFRAADYSPKGIGMVQSYKTGLIWEPVSGYAMRANLSRAQRAPNITELMSPARGDYDTFSDICDGVTATSTDAGHANCRLEPTIAAVIAAEGEFSDENNGYSPNAGNENLKEETADSLTVGFTMAPASLEGFRLAVDYYDIKIEDSISQIGNEDIIKECYDSSAAWGESNSFCNDIRRSEEGNIIEITQRVFNLNEARTRGYDIAAEYSYDLEEYGSLKFKADMTHVIEHSETYEGNDGLETANYNGQLDYGIFQDIASMSLTWKYEDLRLRWSTKYKSDVVDNDARVEDYEERFAKNDAYCAEGSSKCVENPEVPMYLFYPSYTRHNFSASYNIDLENDAKLRLYGGINNVFDNKGPFIPRTGDNYERGVGNFDSKYDGGVGRFVYLGAAVRF